MVLSCVVNQDGQDVRACCLGICIYGDLYRIVRRCVCGGKRGVGMFMGICCCCLVIFADVILLLLSMLSMLLLHCPSPIDMVCALEYGHVRAVDIEMKFPLWTMEVGQNVMLKRRIWKGAGISFKHLGWKHVAGQVVDVLVWRSPSLQLTAR